MNNPEALTTKIDAAGEGYATTLVEQFSDTLAMVEDIGGSGMKRAMAAAIQGAAHAGYMKGYLAGRKEGRADL